MYTHTHSHTANSCVSVISGPKESRSLDKTQWPLESHPFKARKSPHAHTHTCTHVHVHTESRADTHRHCMPIGTGLVIDFQSKSRSREDKGGHTANASYQVWFLRFVLVFIAKSLKLFIVCLSCFVSCETMYFLSVKTYKQGCLGWLLNNVWWLWALCFAVSSFYVTVGGVGPVLTRWIV